MKEIYEQYYSRLVYFGLKTIDDKQAVQDIVTDCFIKFIEHGYPLKDAGNVLFICVRNSCINYSRNEKRHSEINYQLFDEEYIQLEIIESGVIKIMQNAIDALPPDCREVIIMYYLEEKKCVEIARLLNKTPSTIRSLKRHGINKLINLKHLIRQ